MIYSNNNYTKKISFDPPQAVFEWLVEQMLLRREDPGEVSDEGRRKREYPILQLDRTRSQVHPVQEHLSPKQIQGLKGLYTNILPDLQIFCLSSFLFKFDYFQFLFSVKEYCCEPSGCMVDDAGCVYDCTQVFQELLWLYEKNFKSSF